MNKQDRLDRAKAELKTHQDNEAYFLDQLKTALAFRQYMVSKAYILKLEDSAARQEWLEIEIRVLQVDIEFESREI